MSIYAHAGHWAVSLAYVMPVVVIVGVLAFQSWRFRREEARHETPR